MNFETLRTQYRDAILAIAAEHHAENLRIFGSTVRNDARPDSDLDILIHPGEKCSLLDICAMENQISDLLGGKKVDIVSDRSLRKELAPYILKDATPL